MSEITKFGQDNHLFEYHEGPDKKVRLKLHKDCYTLFTACVRLLSVDARGGSASFRLDIKLPKSLRHRHMTSKPEKLDTGTLELDLLIKGAKALLRKGQGDWQTETIDIGIRKNRIVALGSIGKVSTKKTLRAEGLTVLPGLLDTQVHFREPGFEYKEDLSSGTRGALLGGITGIFEMPNTRPSTVSALDLADKLTRAKNRAWVHYAFYLGATIDNASKLAELENLPGCCGVKIFMGSSTGSLLVADDEKLRDVLRNGQKRVAVHCEDEFRLKERKSIVETSPGNVHLHPVWRDEQTALLATKRIIALGKETGRPLHILHVTTAEEMDFLRKNKSHCTVECLPQHLTFSSPDCYDRLGTLAQMNPPIRDQRHQTALWKAVLDGTVDVLGSDHAPHTLEEKQLPYPQSPSGMTGVQTILPVMLHHMSEGRITLGRIVELMAYNPAKIWSLEGRGELKVGARADLTILDLNKTAEIKRSWIASKSGWSPYEGLKVKGWPTIVLIEGQIAMRENEVIGSPLGSPLEFSPGIF